jgi:hypothetical protein
MTEGLHLASPPPGFAWASWLGAVAVVLGIALAATQGTELMKQAVSGAPAIPADQVSAADCREDELEEEGLSFAECRQMVANVENLTVSGPAWFREVQIGLAGVGTIIALGSIVVGVALVDDRTWAPTWAVLTFAALAGLDVLGFIAAVNAGPIIRQLYLWDILLWFLLHLMMAVGAIAGRDSDTAAKRIGQSRAHPRLDDLDES